EEMKHPELESLPAELPPGESHEGREHGEEMPPAPVAPVPEPQKVPAYAPPDTDAAPGTLLPAPGGDASAKNTRNQRAVSSRNLARLRARTAETQQLEGTPRELSGTKMGLLKSASGTSAEAASPVEQTGFF